MPHYDTSKTHPAYSPPPRRLGTGIWIGAIVVIAAVILGVFLWTGLGSGTNSPTAQSSAGGPAAGETSPR
jgi:hypothetical protein